MRLGLSLCLLLCVQAVFADTQPSSPFISKIVNSGKYSIPYSVYLPTDYTSRKKWPVILFLHGSSQCGNDGLKQTQQGIGPSILAHPEWFPAIVILPQCPEGLRWTSHLSATDSHAPFVTDLVMSALTQVIHDYNGDPNRVSLTGLSLGGAGVWALGAALSHRFTALMPLCGRVSPTLAHSLVNNTIWVFHGAKDDVVPVDQSRAMVQALISAGAKNLRYTEFPDANHSIWDIVYNEAEAISFLIR